MELKPFKLCVLCCYSYRVEVPARSDGVGVKSDKQQSVIESEGSPVLSRFCQEILNDGGCSKAKVNKVKKRKYEGKWGRRRRKKTSSSVEGEVLEVTGEEGSSFETMTVCPSCLAMLEKVSEARSRASAVEQGVTKLQKRILAELKKLKEEMGEVYLELGRVEEVMLNGDASCLQSLASDDDSLPGGGGVRQAGIKEVVAFREQILSVLRGLASHQEELSSKLLLPPEGGPILSSVTAVKFNRGSRARRHPNASDSGAVDPFPREIKIENDFDNKIVSEDDPFLPSPVTLPSASISKLDDRFDKDSDPISPASFHEFQTLLDCDGDGDDNQELPRDELIPQLPNDDSSKEEDDDDEEWVEPSTKRKKVRASSIKKGVVKSATKERAPRARRKSITSRPSTLPGVDFTGMSSWRKEIVTRVHRKLRLQKEKVVNNAKSSRAESDETEDEDHFQKFPMEYDPSTGFLTIGDIKDLIINDALESLECSRCPYQVSEPMKFSNPAELVLFSHVLGHHLDAFNCKHCGQKFTGLKRYTLHQKLHKDPDSLKCDKCGKQLSCLVNLRAHQWSHMTKEEKAETIKAGKLIGKWKKEPKQKYPCPTCGKSYTTRSNLSTHENAVHRGKVYVCSKCGKSFHYYPSYYTHIRNVCVDDEHPTLECHLCVGVDQDKKKFYKNSHSLNDHIRRTHTKDALERNFVCHICSNSFKCKYMLKNHVKRHEDRPRSYICHICGADFAESKHLHRHNSICKGPGSRVRARRGDRLSKLKPEEARKRWNYQAQSEAQQMGMDDNEKMQCNVDNGL